MRRMFWRLGSAARFKGERDLILVCVARGFACFFVGLF